MSKVQVYTTLILACCTETALAESSKMRVASESEIREHVERSKDVVTKNGYSYQKGKSFGYKIANGEICILFANGQKDCANVETDGKKFELITRKGDRSSL
jgi:exopolysaccharide biosynthesis protein